MNLEFITIMPGSFTFLPPSPPPMFFFLPLLFSFLFFFYIFIAVNSCWKQNKKKRKGAPCTFLVVRLLQVSSFSTNDNDDDDITPFLCLNCYNNNFWSCNEGNHKEACVLLGCYRKVFIVGHDGGFISIVCFLFMFQGTHAQLGFNSPWSAWRQSQKPL